MTDTVAGTGAAPEVSDTCRAPWVSLRLSPNGKVQACCVNDAYPLGRIGEESLESIWWGPRADALRQAMAEADFSLGCQGCGGPREQGLRSQTLAVDYDHFELPRSITWPSHIEFALSNTCNLQCVQCDGELSSAIRAQREHRPPLRSAYGDDFFSELPAFLPHLRAATFIGGEPFLMREVRRVWDLLLEMEEPPEVWVTTNGTIWDDRVERYLHGLKMGVSMSIDGVRPETIAAIRVGADAEELLANRDRFLAATRSYGRGFKLNYCVMPQNWQEYLPFLLEADALDVPVYAARVQRPAEHSLYALPTGELRAVVEGLTDQGAERGDRLGRNRPVWDGTLAELTAHLHEQEAFAGPRDAASERTAGAVTVAPPRLRPPSPDVRLAQLEERLWSEGGCQPAHITIRGLRVAEVDAPDWAEFLGLQHTIGLGQDEMLDHVVRRLGTEITPVSVKGEERDFGLTFVLDLEGRAMTLHSVATPGEAGATHVLVGVARA